MYPRQQLVKNMYSMENISSNVHRTKHPHMGGLYEASRLFGGQAVAQAFRAVQEHGGYNFSPHFIHYRFIAPGKVGVDLHYDVVPINNQIFRVTTQQNEKIIGSAYISITDDRYKKENLELDYVEKVNNLPLMSSLIENFGLKKDSEFLSYFNSGVYELKLVEWARFPRQNQVFRNIFWARIHEDCHKYMNDSHGTQAALTLSDFFIVQAADDVYRDAGYVVPKAASLQHTVKFHAHNKEIDPIKWMLYRVDADIICDHRAKLQAFVYDEDFRLLLSITQEAYVVPKKYESHL